MPVKEFRRAAVIGSGMMGPGVALSLALGGLETVIVSRTQAAAEQGLAKAREQLQTLEQHGLAEAGSAARAREALTSSSDLESSVAEVDIVVESAPEDMRLKRELFRRLDSLTPADAVLATNTSGLSVTSIAEGCTRPERVLTTHFWNPPYLMRLVEIVRGERTDEAVVAAVKSLLERCGKLPVVVKKDRPGQLGNRLQHALVREALHIVGEGVASVEDVDLAVREGFGLRLPVYGVFEHADAVGLDLVLSIQDYVNQDLCRENRAPSALRERVDEGRLGVKTGEGFYDWSKKSWDEVRQRRDNFILSFLKSSGASD